MKRKLIVSVIVLSAMLWGFTSCVSSNVAANPISIQKIIDVPGENKSTLFVKANSAAVDMFRNASSVIEFSDKESGIIKGKFIIPNVSSGIYYHRINVIITVEVKDGKMRLSLSDVTATYTGDALNGNYAKDGQTFEVESSSNLGQKVLNELDNFINSYTAKITTASSDW
ncbi:MAG: DUF4468 domain-containing protein [Treponema sp.]|jgi:hypothetical protein|nr:DUF4468 domain-containing protein [Treponema sp.]